MNNEVHIPQQKENFLQAYAQGDIGLLSRVLTNFKNIIDDGDFQKDLRSYDSEKRQKTKNIISNTLKRIKDVCESKKGEEALIGIDQLLNELQADLSHLEEEYWEHIGGYIIHEKWKS